MGNLGSIICMRTENPNRFIQESDKNVPCGCCFGATPPYLNPAMVAIVGGIFLEAVAIFVLFYLITVEGRYFIIMNVVFHMTAALWLIAGSLLIYRQMRAKCAAEEAARSAEEAIKSSSTNEGQAADSPFVNGPCRHSIHRFYPTLFAAQQAKKQHNRPTSHHRMNNCNSHAAKYSMLHRQDVLLRIVADETPTCNSTQAMDPASAASLRIQKAGGESVWENQPSYSSMDTFECDGKTRQML